MANPKHLARLKQGATVWNPWRAANAEVDVDLRGADLRRADLNGVDLSGLDLSEANLSETHLNGAFLERAKLRGARLRGAYLNDARVNGADFTAADFFGAQLIGTYLNGACLSGATFGQAKILSAHASEADFSGASLAEATVQQTDLTWANLSQADLKSARFLESNLRGAKLSGTNLLAANLSGAYLALTDFNGANLTSAHLAEANFTAAKLDQANFTGATLGETVFADCVLGSTVGLDTCQHVRPSTIDHRTLAKSGPLPLVFLRGCGLPDRLIDYLPSLLNQPIQFYSCFISYSTKDQSFADRLHADLQNKGVRCWFAPHDIQGGKKLHEQIDEAIRVYDRLLLILSPHSMDSEWVKTEIAKARKREQREKRQMLFPIRLVDFATLRDWECFDADTGKDSAREIREYFIPDFSEWKTNHDQYAAALKRLLKDLQPGR